MPFLFGRCLIGLFLLANLLSAQTPLFLKSRRVVTDATAAVGQIVPAGSGRVHYLVQFSVPPPVKSVQALTARGVRVLGDVPTNGLLVAISNPVEVSDLGVSYAAPLASADKISPLITSGDPPPPADFF